MDGFANLIEFSVALAGFTSVVVVFAHKEEKWQPFDKFRITNALMGSLGAAFLAAIPGGLAYLALETQILWQIEGALIGLYHFMLLVSVFVRRKRNLSESERRQIPPKALVIIVVINATYFLLMCATLLRTLPIPLIALSYFGIILLLLTSVFAFIRLIFFRPIDTV